MIERRTACRYPIRGVCMLVINGELLRGELCDISIAGVGFQLLEHVSGNVLGNQPLGLIHVESDDLPAPVDAYASLRRVYTKEAALLAGCRFESIDDGPLRMIQSYICLARARYRQQKRIAVARSHPERSGETVLL